MSDHDNKYRETAEADVASVEVGDTPSDVESKVIGLAHISGQPSHSAIQGEESAETVEGS